VNQFFSLMSSLLETLYLLRSPANATRLATALERSKAYEIQPQAIKELYKRFGLEENHTEN
jgi:antitoxin YefM